MDSAEVDAMEEAENYKVEKIKRHYTKNGLLLFVVGWKGFDSKGDTEEPASNINHDPKFHSYVTRCKKAHQHKSLCECSKCK